MSSDVQHGPDNPPTPNYADTYTFIDAYLSIHTMSTPSYRYAYLLWFCILGSFLIFALLHWTGGRGGTVGMWFSTWSLRRRTWRKQSALRAAQRNSQTHRQPFALPSNAQLLSLSALTCLVTLVSFVGPDYIAPTTPLFNFSQSRRDTIHDDPFYNNPPSYTINKAWWTVGGRTGVISFAIFPLVVLFALKTPPFALFSLPFMLQLHFDKLVRLHRWTGILLWLVVTVHVVAWSVQLANDQRDDGTHRIIWNFVWEYNKFIYGMAGYLCLTLLELSSIPSFRRHFYEPFYFLHVFLVPLTLVMSTLHFPPIAWWCWATLLTWACERLWRTARFGWINGIFGTHKRRVGTNSEDWEMSIHQHGIPPQPDSSYNDAFDVSLYASPTYESFPSPSTPHPLLALRSTTYGSRILQPGWANAELLPGRAIRLRVATPRPFVWAPGQHVLLRVPSVSKFSTHPFTIANAYNSGLTGQMPHEVTLLVRAKAGFTRDLWNEIHRLSLSGTHSFAGSSEGVLIRTQLEGPFGSASRARWEDYSSVVIVIGGSGVSYGLAVLEYLCMRLSGRSPRSLGKEHYGWGRKDFRISRVRFVWLIREFSHLQWAAKALAKCLEIVPPASLHIDIFVANTSPSVRQLAQSTPDPVVPSNFTSSSQPQFGRGGHFKHNKRHSWASLHTQSDDEAEPVTPTISLHSESIADNEFHPLDLTNFDGDDDTLGRGEASLSSHLHKEGRVRRHESRRISQLVRHSRSQTTQWNTKIPDFDKPSSSFGVGKNVVAEVPRQNPSITQLNTTQKLQNRQSYASSTPTFVTEFSRSDAKHSSITTPTVSDTLFSPTSALWDATQDELYALNTVSELTRPGKPPLRDILRREVERSRGSLGVACCGPTSLNALMRKIVAAQVDPRRVHRGDMRGSITLISEEFEY